MKLSKNSLNFSIHLSDNDFQQSFGCPHRFCLVLFIGVSMKLLACVLSCWGGSPGGLEEADQGVPSHGFHWSLALIGDCFYHLFIKIPCSVFCRNSNEIIV